MIIKGAKHSLAAPKKVEEPAAAPKKERKARKIVPPVFVEPVVESEPAPVAQETIEAPINEE